MRRKTMTAVAVAAVLMIVMACGTVQKSPTTDATTGASPQLGQADTVRQVAPNSEVLSVSEFINVFANEATADETMAKYGYKVKAGYEVYRVEKYDKMYYKNCRLPKVVTDGKYEDYPRALKKGISSYVAVQGNSMLLAVFNNNAYQNLVDQVKMNGFRLDMEGNEDIYTNGKYYIACNKANRTVRIQKAG